MNGRYAQPIMGVGMHLGLSDSIAERNVIHGVDFSGGGRVCCKLIDVEALSPKRREESMKEIETRRSGAQGSGDRRLKDPCQARVADAASACIIHSTTGETGEAPVLSMINTSRMHADTQLLPPNI